MAKKISITLLVIFIWFFDSSAYSTNISTLLEKGIYAEETKGDLDEAISIYKKIVHENSGNSANLAEAYYRLGTCYLKTGDETEAITMFKELLTGFREHEDIASDARHQLLKLNALDEEEQTVKPLELGPVPWEPGETCWYDVKTPAGETIANIILSVKDHTVDGKEMWRIEYITASPVTRLYAGTDVLKENFTPVSAIYKTSIAFTQNKLMRAKFEKGNVRFFADNKNVKKDIPLEGTVYTNSQLYHLYRLLPLKENYKTSLTQFVEMMGTVVDMQIKTVGRETVTVPAGIFDCYCIEFGFGPTSKSDAKFWISNDEKKYIVKVEAQGTSRELTKITRAKDGEPVIFIDNKFGISMTAPEGWGFVKNTTLLPDSNSMMLHILSPELKAISSFETAEYNYDPLPTLETLQGWKYGKSGLVSLLKNYIIRPKSFVYRHIDGLPSVSFIADWLDNEDKKMIAYSTYIYNKNGVGIFTYLTEKDSFDEMKTDFESIIKSVKWKH